MPRLPRTWNVDVTMSKCHGCHANETSMSPSAAPATQSAATPRATNGDQARHQGQPSATSATPATPDAGRCRQVPRLPRTWNVDVTISKCHACQANETSMSPSAAPATQSAATPRATNGDQARHQSQPSATPNTGRCRQVPRLPRRCHQVPRLPRKVPRRPGRLSDQARHQGQPSATSATPATPDAGRCRQVPRLPRTWNVDVTMSKCHACQANEMSMSPSAVPATQSAATPRATNGDQARHHEPAQRHAKRR